jgi:hypothetical protein
MLVSEWRRVPAAAAVRAVDAAERAAEALTPRLGLESGDGETAAVVRLYLVEMPRRSPRPGVYVVADLGEAGAGRLAPLSAPPATRPESARPAA